MGFGPVGVGADVEAQCGRCKEVTWHVVLAMVNGSIARVQCKACDAQHRYRPPAGAGGRPGTGAARSGAGRSGRAGRTAGRSRSAAPPEPAGPAVEPDLSRPVRPYRADGTFEVGDRVQHSTFGLGVVEAVTSGKITLFFPGGRKTLAAARAAPRLQRPPRLQFDE